MNRRWEIDALRGLMLVLMTLTHLPTRLSDPLGQSFGFVTAAEGFVLLSAYMAARVYAGIAQKQGIGAMHQAFWRRALKLYGCHALLLLFLFNEVVSIGLRIDQLAVKNLASFYLAQPLTALLAGLALVYEPPLLDILPMYILFMLASPWVLAHVAPWLARFAGNQHWLVGVGSNERNSRGLHLIDHLGRDSRALSRNRLVCHTGLAVFVDAGFVDGRWQCAGGCKPECP